MSQNFLNISPEKCLNSYTELLENSDRHFYIATLIADKDEFGMAISHLILGSEELVKAIIIYLDGFGLNIRTIKGVNVLFNHHKPRHYISSMVSMI